MVARYSSPHMLKSLHRLEIAIIMDSTNEEWMTKKLMLINKIHQEMSNKKAEASDRHKNGFGQMKNGCFIKNIG